MIFVFALSQLSNAPWRHRVLQELSVQDRLISYYYMKNEPEGLITQYVKKGTK